VIRSGDIHLADLNDEVRRRVLIVSNDRFHAVSGRVLVAPEVPVEVGEVLFPWRLRIDDAVYAVDLLRSLAAERLLERTDRAPVTAMASVRRALLHLT
jgi:mRNA-degrading endonuclease toxin of MazEF toxin-antitoxin module